ncbi:MAG: glycosyltransferase family 4 protein [Gammaproteobacteria bacterium]|nr:glycosyltransferase family 4 protein [Gammaproteobacteria bacterium]
MKKVLHLRSSGSFLGAENVVLQLTESLGDFGYESIIGVIQDSRDDTPALFSKALQKGFHAHIFKADKRFDLECIRAIQAFVENEGIDLVHSHGYKEDIYLFLAKIKCPLIATNHLWKNNGWLLKTYAFLDSLVMMRFKALVAVSRPVKEEMLLFPWLKNKTVHVISNGINTKVFDIEAVDIQNAGDPDGFPMVDTDTLLLGCISSLTIEKGHKILFKALSMAPLNALDWHLIIAGEGPEEANLKSMMHQMGLEKRITFLGRREDVADILTNIDIFMLPSFNEGLPMALLEAMAAGKPVIASRVGDVPEVVSKPEIGMLVDSGDSDMLAKAIEDALSNDGWRKTAGALAKSIVKERYSARNMASEYAEIYNTIVR